VGPGPGLVQLRVMLRSGGLWGGDREKRRCDLPVTIAGTLSRLYLKPSHKCELLRGAYHGCQRQVVVHLSKLPCALQSRRS
jgi:hypothetical protein